MKKRGASTLLWIVASLVVLLFAIIIIFNIYTYFESKGETATDTAICQASLEANARRIELAGLRTSPFVEPKCSFYDVVITDKYIRGKDKEDQVKKILADLMTIGSEVQIRKDGELSDKLVFIPGVWKTVFRGEKKLFEEESAKFCLPWAKISFQGDIPQINNFFFYLLSHNVPSSDESYIGYLKNDKDFTSVAITEEGILDTLYPNKEYALIFTQRSKGHLEQWGAALGGGAVLMAGILLIIPEPAFTKAFAVALLGTAAATAGASLSGYVLGAQFATHDAAVALIPYENEEIIDKIGCEVLK